MRTILGALVLSVALAHAMGTITLTFVELVENLAYDTHLQLTMPNTVDGSVVIVDIDEESLEAEGHWPWPRNKVAHLVETLFEEYEIQVLGVDIVFAERDESSGLKVLDELAGNQLKGNKDFVSRLNSMRAHLDYDGILAKAISKHPVILGYYFNIDVDESESPRAGSLPQPLLGDEAFEGKNIQILTATGYGGNIHELAKTAHGAGHFTQQPDRDGIVRRVPMLMRFQDQYYGSLSLEILRWILGDAEVVPRFGEPLWDTDGYPGLEWLMVGGVGIPVDRHAKTLVPFRGKQRSFRYVSASKVLHSLADKRLLENRIVILGTSAPGLLDIRATPVEEVYPAVEVHANLVAGILDGSVLRAPEYTLGAEVIMLLVVGIGMLVAGSFLSPFYLTLVTGFGTLIYIAFNHVLWASGVVLPVATGVLMVLTMFLLQMSYGYFVETRGKRQLANLFGQYIPPELVDEMAKDPTDYSHVAEQRELTVLFSDVRDFTTLSESVSPQVLSELMNQFLTPMTRVIHESRGTIDKYMGDAIMAFWGAPIADDEHPRRALEAGFALLQEIHDINLQFRDRGWPEIRIGVGINTGVMSVGDMGSEFRMAYTVIGDAVNLGSRLEGLTKGYGVDLIVGETTKLAVPDYVYRELDRVRVKGKILPVAIYGPLCRKEELTVKLENELLLHAEAISLYRSQQWDMAERSFRELQRTSGTPGLYKTYISRIKHFSLEPPPDDWEGVFDHQNK